MGKFEKMMKDALQDMLQDKNVIKSRHVVAELSGWFQRDCPEISDLLKKLLEKVDD